MFKLDKDYDLYSELRLWSSVLELAVRDYVMGNDELMFDAANWIFDTTPDIHFNTFENLCLTLDLDPEAVRDSLKKMNKKMYSTVVKELQNNKRSWAAS